MISSLAAHLKESAFNKALYSDVSVTFAYGALPFSLTYNLHKIILVQSRFFQRLLQDHDPSQHGRIQFTIDLQRALAYKGFLPSLLAGPPIPERRLNYRILGSHIAFALAWLYEADKKSLLESLQPDDIIRVLIIAMLFEISDLTDHCIRLYMSKRLAVNTIVSDLHLIGQLPRSSDYYHELRDAALLILFRSGAEYAESLCELPADWMQDILSAELLFVNGEFERYVVLKRVLQTFTDELNTSMHLNDSEAIERNKRRISNFNTQEGSHTNANLDISVEDILLRKRKRLNEDEQDTDNDFLATRPSRQRYNRFSSNGNNYQTMSQMPNDSPYKLKMEILLGLLNEAVIYSNMTFSQLTTVRTDGLVEEGTVFRALWQREALERLMFPTVDLKADKSHETVSSEISADRHDALSEYFDVGVKSGLNQTTIAQRRRLLLGTPRFRFGASIQLDTKRKDEWKEEMIFTGQSDEDEADAFEHMLANPNGDLASCEGFSSDDETEQENAILGEHWQGRDHTSLVAGKISSKKALAQLASQKSKNSAGSYTSILRNTFYSTPKVILGTRYRVKVEAFVLSLADSSKKLVCNFELQRSKGKIDFRRYQIRRTARESLEALAVSQNEANAESTVHSRPIYSPSPYMPPARRLPPRQATPSRIPSSQPLPGKHTVEMIKNEKSKSSRRRASSTPPKPSIALLKELEGAGGQKTKQMKQSKVRYSVYCLNRHCIVDPDSDVLSSVEREDRAFMPVSTCEEMSDETDEHWLASEKVLDKSYTSNVMLTDGITDTSKIDVMVTLELFDLKSA
jgi:hypothetical protein